MLARTAMSSFSDAHELPEIPIIAANLHRLTLPRQSQIWAVLHGSDSDQRLDYSLAATFLGRMCLSGEIDRLSDGQWARVQQAMALYRRAAPILRDGTSRRFGALGESWRHPTGWQSILRLATDHQRALAVFHTFAAPPADHLKTPLPHGHWTIDEQLGAGRVVLDGDELLWTHAGAFSASVALLHRRD